MKHIVLFSRGAQSAYVAILVAKKYSINNLILLHTPTYCEHPDSDRFEKDICDYLGLNPTVASSGKDLWALIKEHRFIPNNRASICTRELKIKPAREYFKTLNEDFTVYLGYGADELKRAEKYLKRNPDLKVKFPLIEKNITSADAKKRLQNLGFKLPESYLYFDHNNCIPCVKGGKSYFKRVLKYFPEQYWKLSELEEELGYTTLKDISLAQQKLRAAMITSEEVVL